MVAHTKFSLICVFSSTCLFLLSHTHLAYHQIHRFSSTSQPSKRSNIIWTDTDNPDPKMKRQESQIKSESTFKLKKNRSITLGRKVESCNWPGDHYIEIEPDRRTSKGDSMSKEKMCQTLAGTRTSVSSKRKTRPMTAHTPMKRGRPDESGDGKIAHPIHIERARSIQEELGCPTQSQLATCDRISSRCTILSY